jgi:hypothetical protein
MKTKKSTPKRVRMNITLAPETIELVEKVSREMNMSKSAFVEFMLTTMKNAQQLTLGEYVTEVLKDIITNKKRM